MLNQPEAVDAVKNISHEIDPTNFAKLWYP